MLAAQSSPGILRCYKNHSLPDRPAWSRLIFFSGSDRILEMIFSNIVLKRRNSK